MTYTGETGRKFTTRMQKHARSQKLKDNKPLYQKPSNGRKHDNKKQILNTYR